MGKPPYGRPLPNVKIVDYSTLTVRFAESLNAGYIVRSMRMTLDFEYETQLNLVNSLLSHKIKTIYVPSEQRHMHISSTAVRELINNNELSALRQYVEDFVIESIQHWRQF